MASLLDNVARPSAVLLQLSVVLGVVFVLLKVAQFYQKRKKLIKALEAFPGPPKHWLYGHNHLVRRELGSARVGLSQNPGKVSVRIKGSTRWGVYVPCLSPFLKERTSAQGPPRLLQGRQRRVPGYEIDTIWQITEPRCFQSCA